MRRSRASMRMRKFARLQEILDGSAKAWDQVLWDLVTDEGLEEDEDKEDLEEDDLEDSEANERPE